MNISVDYVCLSHLRWNFVYQRPNHLMSRAARGHRVFFVEEPVRGDDPPHLEVGAVQPRLSRVVPHLPRELPEDQAPNVLRALLDSLFEAEEIDDFLLWYYTPMALAFTRHLAPRAIVFDCMDELSCFAGAPPALQALEAELLHRAHVVFTGGQSLYEAKRGRHHNIHLFPSSVDIEHFARARRWVGEPDDQASIPRPRLGYFGVIDERIDLELVAAIAQARPDWSVVMLGPVAKIDEASLPRHANIHYLGLKKYDELPAYLAGWDVGVMPFAINDATRFISPTKTPEYLAAGRPVVSTPIRDVVRPYGQLGIVRTAATAREFVRAIASTLGDGAEALAAADRFLSGLSWDRTWERMRDLIDEALERAQTLVPRAEDGTCSII